MSNTKNTSFLKGQISKISFNDIEAYLFAFCLFLLSSPFYVWNSISPLIFVFICSLLAIKNIECANPKHYAFFLAFFFVYLYMPFRDGLNIFGIIASVFVLTLLIMSSNFLNNVFKKYIFIYSIFLIPSIFVFLLVNFFGIDLPHLFIAPLNQLKLHNYVQYPFLVQDVILTGVPFPRFIGYYDEPGVIGTVSGILLMCSGFNLKKKINIPIFIAGLLSFSFYFYGILLIYGFIFLRLKYKLIMAIVIMGIVILFSGNELFDRYIFDRFEYRDGKFAGDNRTVSDFDEWYKEFSKSNDYYYGLGAKAGQDYNVGGSSYKDIIVYYGIIFFDLLTALFVLRAFSQLRFRKEFFLYLVILFSILYQRPVITNYFYLFLILAPVPFLSKSIIDDRVYTKKVYLKQE